MLIYFLCCLEKTIGIKTIGITISFTNTREFVKYQGQSTSDINCFDSVSQQIFVHLWRPGEINKSYTDYHQDSVRCRYNAVNFFFKILTIDTP